MTEEQTTEETTETTVEIGTADEALEAPEAEIREEADAGEPAE